MNLNNFAKYLRYNRNQRLIIENKIKMKKKGLLFLILSFIFFISNAQEFTVSGYIKDAKTEEPIIGAAVFEANTVTNGTPTDTEGYFSLDFSKADIYLKVGYIGYVDTVLNLQLTSDTTITVFMRSATDIETVEVDRNKEKWKPEDNSIAGNNKIIRAELFNVKSEIIQKHLFVPLSLISYTLITDLDKLFIRNGQGAMQALTFIDGARLYSAKQSINIQPLIDKKSIKSIKYFYGNYPAKYGAYVSPVLDIAMKEGDVDDLAASLTVSLFDAKMNLQTPVISGVSSLFVSGGISYFNNPYTNLFRKETKNNLWIKPGSFNVYAKYTHKLSDNDKVFASIYTRSDRNKYELAEERLDSILYTFDNNTTEKTNNTLISAHWEHVFSPDFVSKLYLTYSGYNLKQEFVGDTIGLVAGQRSEISNFSSYNENANSDVAFNLNFKYNVFDYHNIEFGASATNHNFRNTKGDLVINDFKNSFHIDTTWQEEAINMQEYVAFVQDKFSFSDELSIQGGIHFSTFIAKNKTYFSVQPRVFAGYDLFDWLSLNVSYSNYKQYVHSLSNRYAGLSSDIFIPSDKDILPQFTHHFSAGAKLQLPFDINLQTDFYYDNSKNVIEYKDKFGFFNNINTYLFAGTRIKDRVEQGNENVFGGRIVLSKKIKDFSIQMAHFISYSKREFKNLNFPNTFTYRYNNTQDFSLKLKYKISEDFNIGLNWMYQAGNFITPNRQSYLTYDFDNGYLSNLQVDKQTYLLDGNIYANSGDINSYKLPAYHRADLFVNYTIDNHIIGLTIYNLYNKKNTDFVDFKRGTFTEANSFNLTNYTIIPFFPVLSYTYRFE